MKINRGVFFLLLPAAFCCCRGPSPDYLDIRVDGVFDDWAAITPVYSAPEGSPGAVREVRLADTPDQLFIRLDLDEELLLQIDNDLVFHLDLDQDPATGLAVGEIGSDFTWSFGQRAGVLRLPDRELPRNAYEVGIVSAPAVSSTRFEIEVSKTLGPEGSPAAFSSPEIGWLLAADPSGTAAAPAGTYRLRNQPPAPYPEIPLARPEEPHLRLVSYNVLWDGLSLRPAPFRRILKALDGDIIAFQEIGAGSERDIRLRVREILGGDWYSARRQDCVTVSRYPIISSAAVAGNLATLLDLPDPEYEKDILIVNCHLPFGPKHQARTGEIVSLMAFLDRSRRGEGPIPLRDGTPIVVLGDMNLVGPSSHLSTLLEGEDERPDWDSTPLADLHPYHSSAPRSYTWQSPERTGFGPSRLDYVFYTDSVLAPVRSFVLATDSLSPPTLERSGLKSGDAIAASDHYPVTADFRFLPAGE